MREYKIGDVVRIKAGFLIGEVARVVRLVPSSEERRAVRIATKSIDYTKDFPMLYWYDEIELIEGAE